jgi:hypothetical protein
VTADHAALRNMRRYVDALLAGDWATVGDTLSDEHRFEDRRSGLRVTLDKAGNIEQARVIADIGVTAIDLELVEARDERVALIRQTYSGADTDFDVALLVAGQVDDDGRMLTFVCFDENDLEAARAELDVLAR